MRAALDLTRHHRRGRRKAREIAAAMDVPEGYLPHILADLVRNGILTAVAGPDGGYALASEPERITLLDVLVAAEGEIELDDCVMRGGPFDWGLGCPMHEAWVRTRDAMASELGSTSLAAVAAIDGRMQAGTYRPSAALRAHLPRRRRIP
jgi:Rrf2 family protein